MTKQSDQWETPQWLFDKLDDEFCFGTDLCATKYNKKCTFFISDLLNPKRSCYWHMNCLRLWCHPACFMNPPYSNPYPFIKKALEIVNTQKFIVVCLVKVDPSTKWWALFWDYEKHKPKPGIEVRFLPKRLKFELNGKPKTTAPFPSAIIIMRPCDKIIN